MPNGVGIATDFESASKLIIPVVIQGTLHLDTEERKEAESAFNLFKNFLSEAFRYEYPELAEFYDIDVELLRIEQSKIRQSFKAIVRLKDDSKEFIRREIERQGTLITAAAFATIVTSVGDLIMKLGAPDPPPPAGCEVIVTSATGSLRMNLPDCSPFVERLNARNPNEEELKRELLRIYPRFKWV